MKIGTVEKVTPTLKQRKAFNFWIEALKSGKTFTKKEIMKMADYGLATINKPFNVTNSVGWKALERESGFTEQNAKKVVSEILLDKRVRPDSRLNAADKVFKVHGTYAPEKKINVNLIGHIIKRLEAGDELEVDEDGTEKVVEETNESR